MSVPSKMELLLVTSANEAPFAQECSGTIRFTVKLATYCSSSRAMPHSCMPAPSR
jgi:hypothetical protein